MFAQLSTFDLTFVLSAAAFNLLIAAIFIVQKLGREKLVKVFGIVWLWLIVPLALVFVAYWQAGREARIMLYFEFVLLYMLVEFLLDYIFRIDFRAKAVTHVPYILLEYIALFSLIAIAFDIDPGWGWVVSICFWVLMGGLVFLYWDKIFKGKKT
jgi:hypothetical protein